MRKILLLVIVLAILQVSLAWRVETVFSNGFEDSSGTGGSGYNASVWDVYYGNDGDEAYIVDSSSSYASIHSGSYASKTEEGDEGNVGVSTKQGLMNLRRARNCNLTFWIYFSGSSCSFLGWGALESDDYYWVHAYNGNSWDYQILTLVGSAQTPCQWLQKFVDLVNYSGVEDFRMYFEQEFSSDYEYTILDDITITCEINEEPALDNLSLSANVIKGGNTIVVYASTLENNLTDSENDSLGIYCSYSQNPNSTNTICTGGTLTDSSYPYNLSCSFSTPVDTANHTIYCRVIDNYTSQSNIVNITFETDSISPSISVNNVAGDTTPTYVDNVNDGNTNITVDGEANMSCRWSTSDLGYSSMTNDCVTNGTQAICVTNPSEGYPDFYIACVDYLGNEHSSTTNLDVTDILVDWSAPTTTDDSSPAVHAPTYNVTIIEQDNVDSDPVTFYCIDTTNTCTPNLVIDNNETISFNESFRGINYLRYYSVDDVSNTQAVVSKAIHINRLPNFTSAYDNVSIVKGGSNIIIYTIANDQDNHALTLYVCNSSNASTDGCADYEYCQNESSLQNPQCTLQTPQDNQEHYWYAFIFDAAGEAATNNPILGSFVTDSIGPEITVISPENKTYAQSEITAEISLSETGSWAGYCLDNCTANTTMAKVTDTLWMASLSLENGQHNITFFANDSYCNMENSSTILFVVDTTLQDTTPPTITIWQPEEGKFYTNSTLTFNITTDENASWAGYKLDNATIVTMENTTQKNWYKVVSLTGGYHNVTFFTNDTSTNKNQGNTSTWFVIDTQAPYYVEINHTTPVNNSGNVTCYSLWKDNISLKNGTISHNASGTFVNYTFSLSGNGSSLNITIANPLPGSFVCRFYVYDNASWLNSTELIVSVADVIKPNITNFSYSPESLDYLDPGVVANVTANVYDQTLDSVVLQYKNQTSDWFNKSMTNLTGNLYFANLSLSEGNYTIRIFANDSYGNENYSQEKTLQVFYDYAWNHSSTISDVYSMVYGSAEILELGNLTLNNTGDNVLFFNVSTDSCWVTINENKSLSFNLSTSENITLNVSANISGFSPGLYDYALIINISSNNSYASSAIINKTVNVQNVPGPYLDVKITEYSTTVYKGTNTRIVAEVKNLGTKDATNVVITFNYPSDFSLVSGTPNKTITNLIIGGTATSSINLHVPSTTSLTQATISVNVSCDENSTDYNEKTIEILSPIVTQITEEAVSRGGAGGGAGIARPRKKEIEISKVIEIVRGKEDYFEINVTNRYMNYTMKNIKVLISGFPERYVEITPTLIKKLDYGETAYFKVKIKIPTYKSYEEILLNATILADLIKGTTKYQYKEKQYIALIIHSLSKEESNKTLEEALEALKQMEAMQFNVDKLKGIFEKASQAFNNKHYGEAAYYAKQILATKEMAFQAYNLIQEIKKKLESIKIRGAVTKLKTYQLLNLALAAFERADYELALQRANEAKLTLAIESQIKKDLLYYISNYWWAIIVSILLAFMFATIGHRQYLKSSIARKLDMLANEELNVRKLIFELQEDYFEKGKMSSSEYKRKLDSHQKRLAQIKKERIKLRNKRIKLLKGERLIEQLDKETNEVLNAIKKLQRDYYEKKKIPKNVYEELLNSYHERLAEIEDEKLTALLIKKK